MPGKGYWVHYLLVELVKTPCFNQVVVWPPFKIPSLNTAVPSNQCTMRRWVFLCTDDHLGFHPDDVDLSWFSLDWA